MSKAGERLDLTDQRIDRVAHAVDTIAADYDARVTVIEQDSSSMRAGLDYEAKRARKLEGEQRQYVDARDKELAGRLNVVDGRLYRLEQRPEDLEGLLRVERSARVEADKRLELSVTGAHARLNGADGRLQKLEQYNDRLDATLEAQGSAFDWKALRERVEVVAGVVNSNAAIADENKSRIAQAIEGLDHGLEAHDGELATHDALLEVVTRLVDEHEDKINTAGGVIDVLEAKLDRLEYGDRPEYGTVAMRLGSVERKLYLEAAASAAVPGIEKGLAGLERNAKLDRSVADSRNRGLSDRLYVLEGIKNRGFGARLRWLFFGE